MRHESHSIDQIRNMEDTPQQPFSTSNTPRGQSSPKRKKRVGWQLAESNGSRDDNHGRPPGASKSGLEHELRQSLDLLSQGETSQLPKEGPSRNPNPSATRPKPALRSSGSTPVPSPPPENEESQSGWDVQRLGTKTRSAHTAQHKAEQLSKSLQSVPEDEPTYREDPKSHQQSPVTNMTSARSSFDSVPELEYEGWDSVNNSGVSTPREDSEMPSKRQKFRVTGPSARKLLEKTNRRKHRSHPQSASFQSPERSHTRQNSPERRPKLLDRYVIPGT